MSKGLKAAITTRMPKPKATVKAPRMAVTGKPSKITPFKVPPEYLG